MLILISHIFKLSCFNVCSFPSASVASGGETALLKKVNSVQRKNNENNQSKNENKPDNKRVFLLAGYLDKLKTDQAMFQLESQT